MATIPLRAAMTVAMIPFIDKNIISKVFSVPKRLQKQEQMNQEKNQQQLVFAKAAEQHMTMLKKFSEGNNIADNLSSRGQDGDSNAMYFNGIENLKPSTSKQREGKGSL